MKKEEKNRLTPSAKVSSLLQAGNVAFTMLQSGVARMFATRAKRGLAASESFEAK